ncbi:MAG: hypothetical protein J6F33_07510 [Acidaminococcaceae bacterium]|nr:hypothetical protein [Acidaminococcaceae bacterium]
MHSCNNEVYYVQNPALGAVIIWRFIVGYWNNSNKPVTFLLLFIILPVIFREDFVDLIIKTKKSSGLIKFSNKVFEGKKVDVLYELNNTMFKLRELTLNSIKIGITYGLFSVEADKANVYTNISINIDKQFSHETRRLLTASERFGIWCSQLSLMEICALLKVRF